MCTTQGFTQHTKGGFDIKLCIAMQFGLSLAVESKQSESSLLCELVCSSASVGAQKPLFGNLPS